MAAPTKTTFFRRRKPLANIAKGISPHTIPITHEELSIAEMLPRLGGVVARTPTQRPRSHPLSMLPLSNILRTLAITSASCSPALLGPSLKIISILAHAKSPILSPDTNPILRQILKKTIYGQFCAGENEAEVRPRVAALKGMGFKGVMLAYAREIVIDASHNDAPNERVEAWTRSLDDVEAWKKGTIATIKMTSPGDFVALKFTGSGSQALNTLLRGKTMPPVLKEATDAICDLAATQGIRLLFDAEQATLQPAIDAWTLDYMRKYNHSGKALVYGTYQTYLKACPQVLASHLAAARKGGFTLGVKLVRGAYLGIDPRHLIHDTKADTDAACDGIAESLVTSSYGSVLRPVAGEESMGFPSVNVVLAGHNRSSVRKIQAIRTAQAERGEPRIELVYAQLQGMADEVSCELVQEGLAQNGKQNVDIPQAYKYTVWGTTGECMKFLLRRAQENKDALQRTKDTRNIMASELVRRMKVAFGFEA